MKIRCLRDHSSLSSAKYWHWASLVISTLPDKENAWSTYVPSVFQTAKEMLRCEARHDVAEYDGRLVSGLK